ncbi:Acyl-CoA dehydrogenase family member 10 [Triticum urartu]|uniref:Acyl-CoA dehydrogenase family member 11 n=1 Tax=Triticum urartu TaxID=4572 RepID=M7YFC4_TRIUA|nr:Acyl-CoA dehydrogenase family member 10 [Triticum urartu]
MAKPIVFAQSRIIRDKYAYTPMFTRRARNGKYRLLRNSEGSHSNSTSSLIDEIVHVLKALGAYTDVPVPKVFCLCTDASVIGTPFYIMEYLEGALYLNNKLTGITPDKRRNIYLAAAKTLAAIHKIDATAVGLQKYGKRDNYCKRQVDRWGKQYLHSTGEGKPARYQKMLDLIDWLKENIPEEDSSTGLGTGLVHGDYRVDNLVFHPTEDRVIGVLDWELSTLGNQMCDVAYSCMPYIIDATLSENSSYGGFEHSGIPDGIPQLEEYLAVYCSMSARPWPAANWKFYIAFSLFRGASIYAGVYHRWTMGNASGGERARFAGKAANVMVDCAWHYINRENVLRAHPATGMHVLKAPRQGFHVEQEDSTLTNGQGKFVPSEKLDSAARARKLLLEDQSHVSAGSSNDLLLGAGLTNLEYGYLCEIMGRSVWAPQIFNCGAPDTGNMEVLLRYGTKEQQKQWLVPLLEGKIRSGFAMTEPQVASSDATNIECAISRQGDFYVINGRKWWTSGAMDPRCKILILMGKTDFSAPRHKQQSMILVDINTPGVQIKRPLLVFGFDDAPHGHAEITFDNVRVPVTNILLGEGRGFEIAQGRLGPGRLHHCMRLIGAAERGMNMMVERALSRTAFGKKIAQHGSFQSDLAKCRIELEQTRLLVLEAADQLDRHGNKKARGILAMAKVAAPNMALKVLDMAIQVHGAAGVSSDTVLSHLWATARTLRLADGPDEVHLGTIAKLELQRARM